MRTILVDWLLEVHYKFKLVPQTLWLCVNILDRYLEKRSVERTKLQLVGVASLLLACKYEESGPPEVKDCIFITDYAYTRAEILAMERNILIELNYELCVPTGYTFLTKYLMTIDASDKLKYLAYYYAERNLQEYDVLDDKPHVHAAASLYIALCQQSQSNITQLFELEYRGDHNMLPSVWTPVLQEETGIPEEELIPVASRMLVHIAEEPLTASKRMLIAARKKYNVDKYFYVSSLLLPTIR
jgi:G2/mitotic-specific cyclin-B, other